MKILVTGFGTRHVNSGRVKLHIACGHEALIAILKALGHEVDWRPVVPGEDLSSYDVGFVFVIPPNALTARYCYGGLWALRTLKRAELVVDDWQTRLIATGARTQVKDTKRMWKDILPREHRAEASTYRSELEETNRELSGDNYRWRVWAPMFRYGSPFALGIPARRYVTYDPSSFFMLQKKYLREEPGMGPKVKQWVSASLLDKQDWMGRNKFTWPVIQIGNKKLGQERVAEDDVIRLYRRSWGVISCPHSHAGSGWWRARYPFAAMVQTIVYGSYKDTQPMGLGYRIFAPLEVEEMSDSELVAAALVQYDSFNKLIMTADELVGTIKRGLEDAAYQWSSDAAA